jgi:hypothetical protein
MSRFGNTAGSIASCVRRSQRLRDVPGRATLSGWVSRGRVGAALYRLDEVSPRPIVGGAGDENQRFDDGLLL